MAFHGILWHFNLPRTYHPRPKSAPGPLPVHSIWYLQRGGVLTANLLIINNKMFDSRSKGGCFLFIGEKQTFILDTGVVCGADLNVLQ